MPEDQHIHHKALPAGHAIHWYSIDRVLGQGSFGITYLAHDTNLDQQVAIKEYLPTALATRSADSTVHALTDGHVQAFDWGLRRFLTEARTLAKFRHPNIVRVLSVFEQNSTAYMVMEYEEGDSLAAAVRAGRLRDEGSLRAILLAVIDGLALVHEAGFIHRDIKPDNLFLRRDGTPVLLDFGSARQTLDGDTRTLTALVSPGYAPYEQYGGSRDDDRQGPWTDIYGLGATLYRIVTGRNPVDAMARVNAIIDDKPDPYESALCGWHEGAAFGRSLRAAIDAALAFHPRERPQNLGSWRRLLERADDAIPVPETNPLVTVPTPSPGDLKTRFDDIDARAPTVLAGRGNSSTDTSAVNESEVDTQLAAGQASMPGAVRKRPAWVATLAAVVLLTAGAGGAWFVMRPGIAPGTGDGVASQTNAERDAASSTAEASALEQAAQLQAQAEAREQAEQAEQAAQLQAQAEAREQAEQAAQLQAQAEAREQAEQAAQLQAQAEAREQAERAAQLQAQAEAREQAARIGALLEAAGADVTALRLTSPPGNNAVERYRAVLSLDPDNREAQAGLDNVVERYIKLSDDLLERGDVERPAQYLARAADVLPDHADIAPARQRLATAVATISAEQAARKEAEAVQAAELAAEEAAEQAAEQTAEQAADQAEKETSAAKEAGDSQATATASDPDALIRDRLVGSELLGMGASGQTLSIKLRADGTHRTEAVRLAHVMTGRWELQDRRLCLYGLISPRGEARQFCRRVVRLGSDFAVLRTRGVKRKWQLIR